VATIRNVGRTTIPAVAQDGTPTLLEAWSLPLAADGDTVRLAGAPLLADLPPGGQVALHLPAPVGAAVVVLRLYGDPDAIGRSVPAIILFDSSESDRATLTLLHVPDLRDGNLLSPAPTAASAPIARPPAPPSPRAASVSVVQADAARQVAIGLVPVPASGRLHQPDQPQPSILMRTVSTLPTYAVGPTVVFVPWPGDRATDAPTTLCVAGVPTGIRLVIVALVPQGSSVADPATLRLAWAPVTASGMGATPR
jgi:hypothetical protein